MCAKSLITLVGTCALSLQLFSFSTAFAGPMEGGMDGGGGGAYRLENGTIVTLPEFGVLFEDKVPSPIGKTYEKYYRVSTELNEAIGGIYKNLADKMFSFQFLKPVLNQDKTVLITKKNVDSDVYQKVKVQYREVLATFGHKLQDDKFILPAVTVNKKTYIFPDFELLTTQQKAKILVHEYLMRTLDGDDISRLERILKVDAIIEKVLAKNELTIEEQYAIIFGLGQARVISRPVIAVQLLGLLSLEMDQLPSIEDLTAITIVGGKFSSYVGPDLYLDGGLIQQLQEEHKLKLNYAAIFDQAFLGANAHGFILAEMYKLDEEKICSFGKGAKNIMLPMYDDVLVLDCTESGSMKRVVRFAESEYSYGPFFQQNFK